MKIKAASEKKREELASVAALRDDQRADLEFRTEQARLEEELERILASIGKTKSGAEAAAAADRALSGEAVPMVIKKIEADLMVAILDKLPLIMQSLPIRDTGQTTTIQIDKNFSADNPRDLLGALGLSILPVIRQLVDTWHAAPARCTRREEA
jgi:hypothetical protein